MRDRIAARIVRWLAPIGFVFLASCSADQFQGSKLVTEGGADGADAADGSAIDGTNDAIVDACSPQSGKVACLAVIDAWCRRVVACDTLPDGAVECGSWPERCNVTQCNAAHDGQCSDPKYTTPVCAELTSACLGAWSSAACSSAMQPSPKDPPACTTFWGQFAN